MRTYLTDNKGEIVRDSRGKKINLMVEFRIHKCYYCNQVTKNKGEISQIKTHLQAHHSNEPDVQILLQHLNKMRYKCPLCSNCNSFNKDIVICHLYRAHSSVPGWSELPIPFNASEEKKEKNGIIARLKKQFQIDDQGKFIKKVKDCPDSLLPDELLQVKINQ